MAGDDAATREAVRRDLADTGYGAVEAADGERALAYLRASSGGLVVLLDADLPGPLGAVEVLLLHARRHLPRHAYVVLARDASAGTLPFPLRVLCAVLAVPIVPLPSAGGPAGRDEVLAAVLAAEASLDATDAVGDDEDLLARGEALGSWRAWRP